MSCRIFTRNILSASGFPARSPLSSRQIPAATPSLLLPIKPAEGLRTTSPRVQRRQITMASPNNIKLSVTDAPVFSFNPKVETAEKASELLQKDEQEHNIYFNDMGFHSPYFPFISCTNKVNSRQRSIPNRLIAHRRPH